MKPEDLIYDQVLKRCLAENVPISIAKDTAVQTLSMWKKGQFKKVGALIDSQVAAANKFKVKVKK